MADDIQYSSRSENKRKYDDRGASPEDAAAPPLPRRPTGFSAPIVSPSAISRAAEPPPSSYNSVPPPVDGFQLAKQRAQEIAARLLSDAEAKRPRVEDDDNAEDADEIGFSSSTIDRSYAHHASIPPKSYSQVSSNNSASFPTHTYVATSKSIQIPNARVGAVIGRGGETIKYLQLQSGAKIQVTRYADADPYSQTRTVELTGTAEQVDKAEQLVNDVLQEAEVGSSAAAGGQRFGGSDQFTMKVPNNKVGLVIGKGGESIKNMQARSGARIQVIPLHPPPGDYSAERTVQIDGTKEQIESAKELIFEIISENRGRNPSAAGGYAHRGYQHPPQAPTNWGAPPGPPPVQHSAYGYAAPGAYAGYPPPPPPAAGGYPGYWDPQQPQPGGAAGYPAYGQDGGGGEGDGYGAPQAGYYYGGYGQQHQSYGGHDVSAPASHQDHYQENYGGGGAAAAAADDPSAAAPPQS